MAVFWKKSCDIVVEPQSLFLEKVECLNVLTKCQITKGLIKRVRKEKIQGCLKVCEFNFFSVNRTYSVHPA